MTQPDHVHALALKEPARAELDADLQKYYAICDDKIGFIPNVLRAYSWNQKKLRWFSRFYNEIMLGESGLTPLEREMIAVVVSSANRCYYCQVAHGAAVRDYANDPILGEFMVMNYRNAELSVRHRAMLDFAFKLTTESHTVGEAHRQALRDAGFADADIWDICDVVGLFNMTNRVAAGVDMMPNLEYHATAR
ncbi:MAG: peroxidase-related enzyme [Proteobacteria bacterium]|nr:peroxidase-related enzyme [Pseudomonadota bacterium]MDA1057219.1 peroxidase-related enzyme [Pseudomonadota bacterium]